MRHLAEPAHRPKISLVNRSGGSDLMRNILRAIRSRVGNFIAHSELNPLVARCRALEDQARAYSERVAYLEAHNVTLTEAATERARQLQEKKDLDYQILMTHQQILAGLTDMEPAFREIYERCRP